MIDVPHLLRLSRRGAERGAIVPRRQPDAGLEVVAQRLRATEACLRRHTLVPGAIHFPHGKLVESKLAAWPMDTLFVTYCAGPHCNGAARGALRLARLGRPVKIMAGGITGWVDEGFALASAPLEA